MGGADELAQQVFLPHDVDVVFDIGDGWQARDQIAQVDRAANVLKLVLVLQPLGERNEVDRLQGILQRGNLAKNGLVGRVVEVVFAKTFAYLGARFGRTQ